MKFVWLEIFLFFIVYFLMTDGFIEETQHVFLEPQESSAFEFVFIDTTGLTTENFFKYFDDTSFIVMIYPEINPLYKEKLGTIKYSCERNCNIGEFKEYYQSILEEHHFVSDSINVDYYGVSIDKVLVYVNSQHLHNLLHNCSICSSKTGSS